MAHTPPPRPTRPAVVMQPQQPQESTQAVTTEAPNRARMSLAEAGFVAPALIIKSPTRPFHRLMLSLEGPQGSGKSELADSAPGPGAHLVLDRGIDSVLDNPNPPATRSPNFLYSVVKVPKASQLGTKEAYLEYWKVFQGRLLAALDSPEIRTVVIDGDPDSWELQRLAEFGRLSKVPPILYDNVNAARRALYARCYDSGKVVVATARVRQVWVDKVDHNGRPVLKEDGSQVREWNGEYFKEGFKDGGYVWTIRCLCLYDQQKAQFGFRIIESKVNKDVEGLEFWDSECNIATLVSVVYPHVPLEDWGF